MQGSKIIISNRENYSLNAVYYQKNSSSLTESLIIMCHGFTGDKTEWGRFPRTCERLCEEGFDAIIFDFSGSGENVRIPITLKKQIEDLEDVAAWAQNKGYKKIGTIGLSFGGITSLLSNIPDRKVAVFWAPAFYMTRIIGKNRKKLANIILSIKRTPIKMNSNTGAIMVHKDFFNGIWAVDVENKLRNFDTPSLIVQGMLDPAVIPSDSERAFSLMKKDGKHEIHMVDGADHDFKDQHLEEFIEASLAFLKKYLK